MRFFHPSDINNLDRSDRYCRIRPLVSHLQTKFLEKFLPEQDLSYDESMIEYFGRHPCKKSIRNKPIRFGFKSWCINKADGYLVAFDLYQGQKFEPPIEYANYEKKYGKCGSPLVAMMDTFTENLRDLPFQLYFDNLFTNYNILVELKNR